VRLRKVAFLGATAVAVAGLAWVLLPALEGRSGRFSRGSRSGAAAGPQGSEGAAGAIRAEVQVDGRGAAPWSLLLLRGATAIHRKGEGSGTFVITGLDAGRWSCRLRARGFVGSRKRVDVAPGATAGASLRLRPFGRIEGVVESASGPVQDVVVATRVPPELLRNLDEDDRHRLRVMNVSTRSGTAGRFSLEDLPPFSSYTVVTAHPGFVQGAEPVSVTPGETTLVRLQLSAGVRIRGRLLDVQGSPVASARVHALRKTGAGWEIEAGCRTRDDGSFATPALAPRTPYRLKAWLFRDGLHQVVQRQLVTSEQGTMDVGTMAPHHHQIRFVLPQRSVARGMTLTVAGLGRGRGDWMSLAGIEFDKGEIRLVGLPPGPLSYQLVDSSGDSRGSGTGRVDRDMMTVYLEPAPREPGPAIRKTITLTVECPREGRLLVTRGGEIVDWREGVTGEGRHELEFALGAGRYRIVHVKGPSVGTKSLELTTRARVRVGAHRDGQAAVLEVRRDGVPVSGAEVFIRGFERGAGGRRVPWSVSDADGRARITGIPEGVDALELAVIHEGSGRHVSVGRGRFDLAKVDLGPRSDTR